jgi:hypothetical protein
LLDGKVESADGLDGRFAVVALDQIFATDG